MPFYEFECEKCGKHFTVQESFHEFDEHKLPKCPKCKSKKVQQLVSEVHVQTTKKS